MQTDLIVTSDVTVNIANLENLSVDTAKTIASNVENDPLFYYYEETQQSYKRAMIEWSVATQNFDARDIKRAKMPKSDGLEASVQQEASAPYKVEGFNNWDDNVNTSTVLSNNEGLNSKESEAELKKSVELGVLLATLTNYEACRESCSIVFSMKLSSLFFIKNYFPTFGTKLNTENTTIVLNLYINSMTNDAVDPCVVSPANIEQTIKLQRSEAIVWQASANVCANSIVLQNVRQNAINNAASNFNELNFVNKQSDRLIFSQLRFRLSVKLLQFQQLSALQGAQEKQAEKHQIHNVTSIGSTLLKPLRRISLLLRKAYSKKKKKKRSRLKLKMFGKVCFKFHFLEPRYEKLLRKLVRTNPQKSVFARKLRNYYRFCVKKQTTLSNKTKSRKISGFPVNDLNQFLRLRHEQQVRRVFYYVPASRHEVAWDKDTMNLVENTITECLAVAMPTPPCVTTQKPLRTSQQNATFTSIQAQVLTLHFLESISENSIKKLKFNEVYRTWQTQLMDGLRSSLSLYKNRLTLCSAGLSANKKFKTMRAARLKEDATANSSNELIDNENFFDDAWDAHCLVDSILSVTSVFTSKETVFLKQYSSINSESSFDSNNDANNSSELTLNIGPNESALSRGIKRKRQRLSKKFVSRAVNETSDELAALLQTKASKFPTFASLSNARYWLCFLFSTFWFENAALILHNNAQNGFDPLLNTFKEGRNNRCNIFFQNANLLHTHTNLTLSLSTHRIVFDTRMRTTKAMSYKISLTPAFTSRFIRFIENITNKRVFVKMQANALNLLSNVEFAQFSVWAKNYTFYQKTFPNIFIDEMLQVFWLGFKFRDSEFLINWIQKSMNKISSWNHRLFLVLIKHIVRLFVQEQQLCNLINGAKLVVRGKISVAGNARTRSIFINYGSTSRSTISNRIEYSFRTIGTFTGVLGLHLFLFY